MSQIVIIGQLDVHPEDAAAAAELMRVMMNASMQEPGCHHYSYSRDLAAAGRFQLSELWEGEEALGAHFKAEHLATYRAAMRDLRVLKRTVTRYDVTNVKHL
jgi:quinol monooxygenase YgiN